MSNLSDKPWLIPGHMYQYDIGWLVDKLLSFETELNTAIDLKTIHYADPIQWDITTQYSPNTVVVDPKTGTAYMSKVPVPSGVLLTNTDYWVVIFNYQRIYDKIMSGVAYNDKDNLNATKDLLVNDLVWYGGDLYRATRAIPQGTTYIPGTNLTPTTIADCLATYYGRDRVAQVLNDTVNVSGDYTLNAGDIAETASNVTIHSTQDMVLDADGSLTEQVTKSKTSEVGGKLTERVTGSREIDVDGDDSVHVDGVTSVNRGGAVTEVYGSSESKTVTGAVTEVYGSSESKTVTGASTKIYKDTVTRTLEGETIVSGKNIDVTAESTILHFPDKTVDLRNLPEPEKPWLTNMIYMDNAGLLTIQSDIGLRGQGFAMSDDRFFYALRTDNEATQYIYSIDRQNGGYTSKSFTNLGHVNSMTYGNGKLFACTWKLDNSSNGIAVINPATLVIESFLDTNVPINAISFSRTDNKLYGRGSNNTFYIINTTTGTLTKMFDRPAYPFKFTGQGMAVYGDRIYLPTTSPTALVILDFNGTVLASYNIFPWAGLFRIKELEDLEIDANGIMYGNSAWLVPGHKPGYAIPMQFAKYNLAQPQAVDLDYLEQLNNHATLPVNNTTFNFIRGNLETPFYDLYEAFWAAQAIAAYGGTPITVNVTKTTKPYITGECRGTNVAIVNGNMAHVYSLGLYDGAGTLTNLVVDNPMTVNSTVVATRWRGVLNTIKANSKLSPILFNFTDCDITAVGVANSDYQIQIRAENSQVACYKDLKFGLPNSSPVTVQNGIYAGSVKVTTTNSKANLPNLSMDSGYTRFSKYVLSKSNVAKTLYGNGIIKFDDDTTVTLSVQSDGLYLKGSVAMTVDVYLY